MAKRLIHEKARRSRSLDALSDAGERLFWRLVSAADCNGRFEADPELAIAACYPRRQGKFPQEQMVSLLAELEREGIIQLYTVSGERFGAFPTWGKYQRTRGRVGQFPAPAGEQGGSAPRTAAPDIGIIEDSDMGSAAHRGAAPRTAAQGGAAPRIAAHGIKDGSDPDPDPDQDPGSGVNPPLPPAGGYPLVFRFWRDMMGYPRALQMESKRLSKYHARRREGYTDEDMLMAIIGCASSPHHMGANDRSTRFDHLDLILRTGADLERFRSYARLEEGRAILNLWKHTGNVLRPRLILLGAEIGRIAAATSRAAPETPEYREKRRVSVRRMLLEEETRHTSEDPTYTRRTLSEVEAHLDKVLPPLRGGEGGTHATDSATEDTVRRDGGGGAPKAPANHR